MQRREKYKGSRTKNKDKADFQIDSININKEQHATVSDFSAQPRLNQFRGRGARAGAAEPVRMKLPQRLIPSGEGKHGINLLPVGIWDCWLLSHPECPGSQSSSCWQRWAMAPVTEDTAQWVSWGRFGVFGMLAARNGVGGLGWVGSSLWEGWVGDKRKETQDHQRSKPKAWMRPPPLWQTALQRTEPAAMPGCFPPAKHTNQPQAIPPSPQEPLQSGAVLGRQ